MGSYRVTVEFPEELIALLGSAEATAAKAKESLVLELLREARISQGKAAELLDLTRYDILELMARYPIASGPETSEEMRQETNGLLRHQASGSDHG